MPNGSGGSFDGDGSVRWEVATADDMSKKSESLPYGDTGRKAKGADKQHGEYFKIALKVPNDGSRAAFLAQFNVAPEGDVITVYLKILKQPGQIGIDWVPGITPPKR